MCSSVDKQVAASDIALQKADTALANTTAADYGVSFADQQQVLGRLKSKLDYMSSNPMGYSPQELHTATTAINENTSRAAKQAIGAAAAFGARSGASDVGSGVMSQVAGQIASEAAQSKAAQLSSLSQQNESMKRQNMLVGLQGLESVGSQYGSASGTSLGGATSASTAGVGAGSGAVAADMAGIEKVGGIMSAVGGLVGAGASFVEANPRGIFGG